MERWAGTIALSWGIKRAIIAFLAGAIGTLALPPFDFLPIGFISFTVLVWLLDGASGAPDRVWLWRNSAAFITGWWFGFGYFVAGLWWLSNAILIDAPDLYWAIPFAVLGLPAVLALFFGTAAAVARFFWGDGLIRIIALAISFGLFEILRGFAFTGFPWNSLGMMVLTRPVWMQITALIGVEGVTFLAVFIFALPAIWAANRHRYLTTFLAVLLIGGWGSIGLYRLHDGALLDNTDIQFRLVQPSIAQDEKWDAETRDKIFQDLLALSFDQEDQEANEGAKPDLIIWPETALPFLFSERPQALSAIAGALEGTQLLLSGIVRREGEGSRERYYNAVVAVDSQGEISGAADKTHLVPFGEYLPFHSLLSSFGLRQLTEAAGAFSEGTSRGKIELSDGRWLYPLICYEAIFSREIQIEPSNRPVAFVNVTNDAWFGNSPGPAQHFRHAQLRSVEFGIPMMRVANNGLTGIVDAHGYVRDGLALNAIGLVEGLVPQSLPTTIYSEMGNIARFFPMLLLLALGLLLGVKNRIDRRRQP